MYAWITISEPRIRSAAATNKLPRSTTVGEVWETFLAEHRPAIVAAGYDPMRYALYAEEGRYALTPDRRIGEFAGDWNLSMGIVAAYHPPTEEMATGTCASVTLPHSSSRLYFGICRSTRIGSITERFVNVLKKSGEMPDDVGEAPVRLVHFGKACDADRTIDDLWQGCLVFKSVLRARAPGG